MTKEPNKTTEDAIFEAAAKMEAKKIEVSAQCDVKKMSIYVTKEMHRALALWKIDEGKDMNSIIIEAIQKYLDSTSGI
jgi:predicted HicB family RNase H-like nuclease